MENEQLAKDFTAAIISRPNFAPEVTTEEELASIIVSFYKCILKELSNNKPQSIGKRKIWHYGLI